MNQYELLNEYIIPLIGISKNEGIYNSSNNSGNLDTNSNIFNLQIEYYPGSGLPFNDLREIDTNYYIKSIHSFVFAKPIKANDRFIRIFEVPSDLAEELEHAFEYRLNQASLIYLIRVNIQKIKHWFQSLY